MRETRVSVVALLITSTITFAQTAQTPSSPPGNGLPDAPGAQVTTLKIGDFNEPAVAVNPRDPTQVVAAFQGNVYAAYSRNLGKDWNVVDIAPKDYKLSGDVSATFDNQGRAFICYIAFDRLGTHNYWARGATRNGIFVRRSLDGGQTWEARAIAVAEEPTKPGIPFEDKPVIVADTSNGPHAGTLYVGWTRWTLTTSSLVVSHSTDGGLTWSDAVEVNALPGLPRDDNGANEGFTGTVTPDGVLYATWSDGTHIVLTSSSDGGTSFSKARHVIETAPEMFDAQGLDRANGFPQIASAPDGELYLAWTDYRNGDIDAFLSKSGDRGQSWSEPLRVNDDPVHNGADQFFQWLSVDPKDGSVNLIFYDRRGDERNNKTRVTLARSTDGGRTFKNYAWTQVPFVARRDEPLGDYIGLAAFAGRVYGVWSEIEELPKRDSKIRDAAVPPHTAVRVGVADFH